MGNTESSMDPLHQPEPLHERVKQQPQPSSLEFKGQGDSVEPTTMPTHEGQNIELDKENQQSPASLTKGDKDSLSETATETEPKRPNNNARRLRRKQCLLNMDASESNVVFRGTIEKHESDLPPRFGQVSSRFQEEEHCVRQKARRGTLWLALVNGYSAIKVFCFHLISLESLFSIFLSVGLTIFTYYKTDGDSTFDGTVMDWVLLSFAVITPLSTSIGMAFTRREKALMYLTQIRSTMIQLYSAHASWDWTKAGKEECTGRCASKTTDWLEHSDETLVEILGICHTLNRFLTLPNATRARHRNTSQGREEASKTLALGSKLYGCMLVRFGRLTDLCEVLKAEGLPPNEATRVRQWERMVLEATENLRMIKVYRTPQALRSFARLFTVFLPPFYAPYYAEIAKLLNSLGVGIAFSVLTSLALTALFETISQMEDPFLGYTSLDGVDVDSELSSSFVIQCLTLRSHFYPNARPFEEHRVTTTTCEQLPVREFTLISTVKGKGKPTGRL